MSTRTKSTYQDPRYLQLWLTFDWPKPNDRMPVQCAGCGWTGRRARRSITVRPCPRCAGPVLSHRNTGKGGAADVVQLAGWWSHNANRAGQPNRKTQHS